MAHAYLRHRDGSFTVINVPGAGTGAGQGTGTSSGIALNVEGALAGAYIDSANTLHGYLRAPDGKITKIDAPGAGLGPGPGTDTDGVNALGVVPGLYVDSSGVSHGFVRAADGNIAEFNVTAAGTGAGQGTVPEGLISRARLLGASLTGMARLTDSCGI